MFLHSWLWRLMARVPIMPAARLHRAGLAALARGENQLADRLCERAAIGYRRELECAALARVRRDQQIARGRGALTVPGDAPQEARGPLPVARAGETGRSPSAPLPAESLGQREPVAEAANDRPVAA